MLWTDNDLVLALIAASIWVGSHSPNIQVQSYFFFSSRRRHTRYWRDWSSDVCSSDLEEREAVADKVDVRGAGPRFRDDPYVIHADPLSVYHLYELELLDDEYRVVGERVALLLHLLGPGLAVVAPERLGVVAEALAPDDAGGREAEGRLVDGDHPHAAAGGVVPVHDVYRLAPARHDLGELFFGVVRAGGAGCRLLTVQDLPDQALPQPAVPIPAELQ